MKNQTTRFTCDVPKAVLTVYMRHGKKGINLGVSAKMPGSKTTASCQSTIVPLESDGDNAMAVAETNGILRMLELVTMAKEKGWTEKVRLPKKVRTPKRPKSDVIPTAPLPTVAAPTTDSTNPPDAPTPDAPDAPDAPTPDAPAATKKSKGRKK